MKKLIVGLSLGIFLIFLLFLNIKKEPDSTVFYDGVYAGCFLMIAQPNMTDIEITNLDFFCREQTTRAMEARLLELFYIPQTEVPQTDSQSSTTY